VSIAPGTDEHQRMLREALEQPWYHTIELEPGAITPGSVDLRSVAPRVLPERLDGMRALDVGTFDGFWAFELERRGAEVLAADLDRFDETEWPPLNRARLAREAQGRGPGERFELARALLGSRVRRVPASIYELSVERLGAAVDIALVGDLLIHLRDPVRGLERVHEVLAPGGRLLLLEEVNVALTLLRPRTAWASLQARGTDYNWWRGNLRCLTDYLALAGFEQIRRLATYKLKAGGDQARWHMALSARRPS
jgi:SAM-dependent methyltransferase